MNRRSFIQSAGGAAAGFGLARIARLTRQPGVETGGDQRVVEGVLDTAECDGEWVVAFQEYLEKLQETLDAVVVDLREMIDVCNDTFDGFRLEQEAERMIRERMECSP